MWKSKVNSDIFESLTLVMNPRIPTLMFRIKMILVLNWAQSLISEVTWSRIPCIRNRYPTRKTAIQPLETEPSKPREIIISIKPMILCQLISIWHRYFLWLSSGLIKETSSETMFTSLKLSSTNASTCFLVGLFSVTWKMYL